MRVKKCGVVWIQSYYLIFLIILICYLNNTAQQQLNFKSYKNDLIPFTFQFEHFIYNVTIPENSVGKTYAIQPPNEDRLGIKILPNIDVKFRIINGDKEKLFKAEERHVGDFVFLAIRTRTGNVILNREKTDEYNLNIKASATFQEGKGRHVYESETIVHIKVLDRNDLSPLFYPTDYIQTVPEDIPLHKSILKVIAEDADLGINGEIYYSFMEDIDYFGIHPTTGIITTTRPLKYIEKSQFELTVLATDRGIGSNHRLNQASKAKVTIKVQPVNLYAPDIYVQTLPEISENSKGNIYGIVRVTDQDNGIHGKIKSLDIINGDPEGYFRIIKTERPGEYNIEIHQLLDREKTPKGYNLTLHAIDCGIPSHSSYKTIQINIADINDNKPIFNRQIYEISIPETSPPNTPVIRLKVNDFDIGKNSKVFLEIVGGNEGNEFYINPDTGMLYTKKLLDTELKSFYTLTVTALDQANIGIRKQSSAKVKINIEDRNDNDPIFDIINQTISINENELSGTIVTKIIAHDRDTGDNGYISYSIANINDVPFDIDHFTGIIRSTKLIDYETMLREYILYIRASDWGLPYRRQNEINIIIKINDINDNRPQFERIDCIGHIPRYLKIGTEILTLSAIDYDHDNYISYRIISGNDDNCFNLDIITGIISIGCDLNDIRINIREINVTATDGTHFADIMTIKINLLNNNNNDNDNILMKNINIDNNGSFECRDTGVARRQAEILAIAEKNNILLNNNNYNNNNINEYLILPSHYGNNIHTPEFINFPNQLKINETIKLGTTIVWIKAKDRDFGYNGRLIYGISDGDNDSVFHIDLDTGELQIIGYLDRERQNEYILNITVYDLGKPQKSISKMLPIIVLDINDNKPKLDKTLFSINLMENSINGTNIVKINATDADINENAKLTYHLITDTIDFNINQLNGNLYINNKLDREKQNLYELLVRVYDGDINNDLTLYSDAIIRIIIDDINDNSPLFTLNDYTFRIREDIPKGTIVAIINAIDYDIGLNGEILYQLIDDDINKKYFKIDKYSGIIRTIDYLDYEERQLYSLQICAIDRGTPSLTSNATILIEIIDVNENRYSPEFNDFVFNGSIKENSNIGTFVMNMNAIDNDSRGPDSRITYSIRGGDGLGCFAIDNDGTLRTMAVFDVETKPHYWITVCAQDQAVVPLYSCVPVFIQVENINDNVPLTENAVYYPSIPEGSPVGQEVLRVLAVDRDIDPFQRITYSITSGNPEGFFAINSTTGVISTTARKLDRENQSEHILEVSVSDNGNPPLTSTARVVITVDDINDQSPEFDQRFYKVQVPATAKLDDALFQVLAIDNDYGENGRITYSIKSGKGKAKFRIHPDTGIIYAAKPFEPDNEYALAVRAEDNGNPKRSHTTRVNVLVVPIPNNSTNPPYIKSKNQEVEVTESDNPGFLVALIQANDEDDDQIWYDIVDGDSRNEFYIGRDNGNILLAKSLDWETQKDYNLTISVTDGIHIVTTQLYVRVIDINDHRPEFTENIYNVDISENIEEESEILQLHATDNDEDKTIYYILHAARDPISLSLFRIDSISGKILTTQRLDRELIAEHILIVIAKDQGTPAKRNYAKVIITVHDHNDHAPEFMSKLVQGKVFETAAIGSNIVQMYAIDRDIGENGKITYTIVSGNIGNVFEIDPVLGIIRIAKLLDINLMPEYMLQVKATDGGSPTLSSQIPVHIVVTMADNDPPRFLQSHPGAEIFENLPIGVYVLQVEARSTSSVYYEIINGNNDDMFFINPSTGVITTKDNIDYEKQKFFNITIRATNMASASATCSAVIHILDQNDNLPYFEQNVYNGEISESAKIASLVISTDNETQQTGKIHQYNTDRITSGIISTVQNRGPLVIKAFDSDSGLNALLHYDIIENLAKRYFHIDSTTGAVKTIMLLDHEKIPEFNFHVKVTDLGKPRLSSKSIANVRIIVNDVNDCAPVFEKPQYYVTLLLPTYENVVVIRVNASDPDTSSENTTLRYDIIEGNTGGVFTIDPDSGVITTRNVEKIEATYKLHIRASDGKFSSVTIVNIDVETSESSGLKFQKSIYEGSISENSTKIITVAVVNVLGSILNEHIEYRILNPTDMFRIGLTSGVIETTGKSFDREVCENYELIIEAKSKELDNDRPRIAHVIVNTTILDINDNCPLFVNLPYYALVSVDDPKGSIITKVHAVDLDSYENGEVRYEMKRGHGELFKVDRKTGEVTLKKSLEGHNRDYELIIAAYDGGITPCSTDVTVNVKVIDKSMPVFCKQFYSDIVDENIEVYTPLTVALQADSPLGRKLIYTIVKGNELEEFAVDFNTGAIYVVDELDYEKKQNYELIIRATDSVSGVSAEVPVSILVQDINDNPPEIEKDIYNITVSEGSPLGTPILKVFAKDNDTGINSQIIYTIQNDVKNLSEYFHIDPNEGIIYLKKSLDRETNNLHHFTLIATDQGIPSLSSTSHVWVTVLDMNDNAPKFEQPSYNCFLSEHANRGQFVTIVTASDPDYIDHDSLIYKIAEGNELQTYDIDSMTGAITLINMQNFAENYITVLNISVTDGVYTSFTRVKVNILPGNLHTPIFPHLSYDVKLNENQLSGRHVMTVVATDKDFGDYGTITYDIFSDEMKEYFTIDKNKGIIEAKTSLDREIRKSYEIPIIASDTGGKSGFTTVKVKVGDENDNPPFFIYKEYKALVYNNLPINGSIIKVKAVDIDDNQNAVILYSIYDSENSEIKNLFDINENTGEIFLRSPAEDYTNQLFQFFVRATDCGIPALNTDVPVDILIIDQNQIQPEFEKKERKLFISESSAPGTIITRMKLKGNLTANFKLITNEIDDDPQFSINERGELTLARTLDREKNDIYTIGILGEISGTSPSLTTTSEIILHVQDENDNAPIFESQPYVLILGENIEKGSSIMKVTAHDADSGSNGEIRYYLSNDFNNNNENDDDDENDDENVISYFDIDVYTGWITTLVTLDKEQINEFKLNIIASDHGQPRHTGKTFAYIKLKDYNDNPPYFKEKNYTTSVKEDALPGTVLIKLDVIDRDNDILQQIDYYILSGDPLSQFQIKQTGEIYVLKELDRENIDKYLLKIIATDGRYTTETNITINIIDINDNPPYCLKYRYREILNESIIPGTYILKILANDADENHNSKLRYYLTGNNSDDFILDKDTGILKTARQLDRELLSNYKLIAHVQDREHLLWECSSIIEINIIDLNDNHPEFTMSKYIVTLSEDAEIGTLVTKIHAIDHDIGLNRKIFYKFSSNNNNNDYFNIISDTGIITLIKNLDRETISVFNLTIIASDYGIPQLTNETQLIINIQDINDNPPEFTSKYYYANIPENSLIGTEIIKILATSRDTGINAEIFYSLIGGNEQKKFKIDNKTGILYVNDNLDYERTKDYFLTIQAIDGGIPPLSNLATINITINDFNDNKPQFLYNSYNARIREDANINDEILQVYANDIDSNDNGKINYFIERGDHYNQFNIDTNTGYITVAKELDRETISNYVLEIKASDNGIPILSNYININIEITDANDNPPLFTQNNYTAILQENKQLDYIVIKFDIIDADIIPNTLPYTFDFRSGNDGEAFRLEQDGTLRTATRFNHKLRNNYLLQIRVFDNGTPPLYSDTFVSVKIIEESQYPPIIIPLEILINSYMDNFIGGYIGKIYANDQDQYDTLIYDLIDNNNNLFNISKSNGNLYAKPQLDTGNYRLNVSVTDGKFISYNIIRITVDIITNDMLDHSITISFNNISPENFILSYRKGFIRSIRTAMRTRQKDIIILAVQSVLNTKLINNNKRSILNITNDILNNDLDVLFTVRKQQVNPLNEGYFDTKEILATITDNYDEIIEATNLNIKDIIHTKCFKDKCIYGKCKDKIIINKNSLNTIATDVTSFVSYKYDHINECECNSGYGGNKCDQIINICAKEPCPPYMKCIPNIKIYDNYHCICQDGFTGNNCDHDIKKCLKNLNNNIDDCYKSINPVTFNGKSYIQYNIDKDIGKDIIENQLYLSLKIRTIQQTGCIMYSSGKIDYNILEIQNGIIQYRYDLGSGDGLISVTSIYVSDGEWHDIKLERQHNSARLIVDNKHVAQGQAKGFNIILNLQINDIYFGAEVRSHPTILGYEDIQRSYIGCIDDIRISNELLPLNLNSYSKIAVLKRFSNIEFKCDTNIILKPLGICGTQPCLNGGLCKEIDYNNYECNCHKRFNGKLCENDLDPCISSPCLYGGKCIKNINGNYTCNCPLHMTGKRCNYGRYCIPNPCNNGGICEEGDNGPLCICHGYKGLTCEIDINECDKQPCGMGATCINDNGSFHCICPKDLTGASCGDPLYSNSITTHLINLPFEHIIGIISGIIIIILIIIIIICCIICTRKTINYKNKHNNKNINNDKCNDITLNSISSPLKDTKDYKRCSKLSNLEIIQRPLSYTSGSNNDIQQYQCNNTIFVNNLDTLRSYGSAGDELENIIPHEYQKLNHNNQQINLNGNNMINNDDLLNKQKWCEQMHLKTFTDNKINNDLKRVDLHNGRLATLKSSGIIQGRLLNVPLPNPNTSTNFDDTSGLHGQYHWDCSDWVRHSQNPLPNITEVPGSEIPDSSSFHSNESNESNTKQTLLPPNLGPIDPIRDIDTLNEEAESEFLDESEYERSEKPLSISFEPNNSIPNLNPLDSGSEDYRFSTASSYVRHPNSYLPRYNIQSETDGEVTPLTGHKSEKFLENGVQQSFESDDEDIPAYGFPKRRNRRQPSDIDLIVGSTGGENSSLLGSYHHSAINGSNSDISTHLCEIDDSEFDEVKESSKTLSDSIENFKRKDNRTNSVQQTDV